MSATSAIEIASQSTPSTAISPRECDRTGGLRSLTSLPQTSRETLLRQGNSRVCCYTPITITPRERQQHQPRRRATLFLAFARALKRGGERAQARNTPLQHHTVQYNTKHLRESQPPSRTPRELGVENGILARNDRGCVFALASW